MLEKALLAACAIVLMCTWAMAAPPKARLVIDASQPAVVDLSDLGLPPGARVEHVLTDYEGNEIMRGAAPLWADGTANVSMIVSPGYYELHYPKLDKSFGVALLPGAPAERDPFFCIDAALSWLTQPDERPYLIDILARMGIDTVRERLSWSAVNPAADQYDWKSDRDYDVTRKLYEQRGLQVLEVFHDAPAWIGLSGEYPVDMVAFAQSWRAIAAQWGSAWGSIEMWNEPDIKMFSGGVPADQYVVIQKAASYVFGPQAGFEVGGGIFTHVCPDAYRDLCARNGLLDTVDFISFHTYDRAPTVEELVSRYRAWLTPLGKASMPLWITESGRPWSDPEGRPSRDKDAESALDITMKGIEFRACGSARYFPFVFPYYEERGNIFSMMHKDGSPHRAIAAWANAIHVLSHAEYLGDLVCQDPAVVRARAFRAGDGVVVALYTGKVATEGTVTLPLAPARVAGIDGRALTPADNTVPVPDGLTYVWYDKAALSDHFKTDTAAMALYTTGRQPAPVRPAASPVVLQARMPLDTVNASDLFYTIPDAAADALSLTVVANNLGETPQSVALTLTGAAEGSAILLAEGSPNATVEVAPVTSATHVFALSMNPAHTTAEPHILTVTGRLTDGSATAPLAIALRAAPTLERLLARYPAARPFPLRTDLAPSQSSGGMDLSETAAGEWRLQAHFDKPDGGDHWAYPPMDVAGKIDFTRTKGFVLRVRLEKPGSAHILLFEEGGRYGFMVPQPLVPADGEWHAVEYLLEDVVNMPTHTKPSGKPDWSRVDKLAIGMSTPEADNVLMVSGFHVIGTE